MLLVFINQKNFKMVRDCIRRSCAWVIQEQTTVNDLVRYEVVLKDGAEGGSRRLFSVECSFDGSLMNGAFCPCRKIECEAIPCAHIFAVLVFVGAATIPPCCVSKRWTMEAKAAFVSVRNANTHVWSEEMSRYRELRNIASMALFKVSKSGERSQQVKDYLQSIIDGPIENDDNTEETTFGPIPSHYSAASQASVERVLDPKIVDTKGAPCKKRMKPFHETLRETNGRKKRTRSCGQCKSSEHDRRKCPDLGK